MKLIVTIPAFNEKKTIADVIKSIPKKITGISQLEILVYDDGSTDNTSEIAKASGATHVFKHKTNFGLAKTFKDAMIKALEFGADIVVNTDADNQYDQREIEKLVRPILKEEADMVIGDRQIDKLEHMPKSKKYGNKLGSFMIQKLTGTNVVDASSGFRAFTKELANDIYIASDHTYTHEMIIAAHYKNYVIVNVPIIFKKRTTGGSRLISGVFSHIMKSGSTILRTLLLYRALAFFSLVGGLFVFLGVLGIVRFLYFAFIEGDSSGHVQSLIISSVIIGAGVNIIVVGMLADSISINRRLIEEVKKK
jgi:glycosyltransferase involved in cell wall biosynthesis